MVDMDIVVLGDEILRQKAQNIADIDTNIKALSQQMLETMYRGKGIGLAAPQVGLSLRMFVLDVEEGSPLVFINPSLLETSEELEDFEEGCLSIPGVYAKVARSAEIRIQAWNERGRPFTMEAEGFLARVIQHEMDHLNGVLFTDRLPEIIRAKLLKQYEKRMRA